MAKIGKILLAVVEIGAIIALNHFAPGIASALTNALGFSVSAFAVTAIGAAVITLAGSVISNALFRTKIDMSNSKINVRLEEPPRNLMAGLAVQGGGVVFAEFDGSGNLWWIIVHGDSPITGNVTSDYSYVLDSVPAAIDGSHNVTTTDFTDDGDLYFKLWTHTFDESNPVPSGASELAAAFPSKWDTASHMLVGTTYTVGFGKSIKISKRYKIYRWRGPLGMGEPNIAVFGTWSYCYDPRDNTQVLGDRTTYKPTRNASLIWAWFRTHPYGRNKPESDINWTKVGEQATICDQSITGIESVQPRYECSIIASDQVDRATIEQQIMMSCDGQLVFDDNGKTWMRAGSYYVPTLGLSRNRDIIAMESVEAQDGESETQGVIVRYLDHDANFTLQPSAPWYNPNYYVAGQGNKFLTVDIPTISNHNQAMRVAKSIGMRSQPLHKLVPTTGLRGLRAMQERIVNLNYDNEFAGDYEIATTIEVDESGMFCSMGLVPIDANRFDLLAGEEKHKPNASDSESATSLSLPNNVVISYTNGQIQATFDVPIRDDVTYEFQYIAQSAYTGTASDRWSAMSVDMDALKAYSGATDQNTAYYVRWRTVSSGGSVTAWYDPPYALSANPLPAPTAFTATNGTGKVSIDWRNPNDNRFGFVRIYRGTTTTFSAASDISGAITGGIAQNQGFDDIVAAGTYYYWIVAYTVNNVPSPTAGPITGVSS